MFWNPELRYTIRYIGTASIHFKFIANFLLKKADFGDSKTSNHNEIGLNCIHCSHGSTF